MAAESARRGELIAAGREVAEREARAAARVAQAIGEEFAVACELVLGCRGRIVCLGLGKSGIIARKLAASLASLGTPALFVHAADALHGDLGMITEADAAVLFSHSGTTAEMLALLEPLAVLGIPVIAMTDRPDSPLAEAATVVLCPEADEEADHLGLAPTASTTAALVLADALAVAVARAKGFDRGDFARSHPGGALGRALGPGDPGQEVPGAGR